MASSSRGQQSGARNSIVAYFADGLIIHQT
jgi:hypothetical protein